MIPAAIKERLSSQPFKPFVLKLVGGEKFEVRHPELVSLSLGGRRMILWVGEEKAVDIDVLLIESLQESARNGHQRRRSA